MLPNRLFDTDAQGRPRGEPRFYSLVAGQLPTLDRMNTPRSEAEILAEYDAGARSFTGLDLDDRSYDFSGAVLAGADFSKSFITADFRGADLRGAKFIHGNVKTSDFRGADLRGASFAGSAIDGAEFAGARLDGVTFEGASEQGHVYHAGERPHAV